MKNDLINPNSAQIIPAPDPRLRGDPDQNPAAVYLAGLAPGSRRAMHHALRVIAAILSGATDADEIRDRARPEHDEYIDPAGLPWERLRFQHVAAVRARLAEIYAFSTANKILSALRGVLKASWQLGLMSAEEYHKATSIEGVKGSTLPAGREVPAGELAALMNACEQSPAGIRDAAMIALLYSSGLRREELVALDMEDVDIQEMTITVHGKGNKTRKMPVAPGADSALLDWIATRGDPRAAPEHVRGGEEPLFTGQGNRNRGGRLTTQAVYYALLKRARIGGVAELSPHDLRRTFVGDLLDRGVDIVTVQKLAGHASPATTSRYDRRGERVKRQAIDQLHVPYTRRTIIPE